MGQLNPIIHQPARLRIMAALVTAGKEAKIDFSSLGRLLDLTDGNLGSHLETLEKEGLIKIEKNFVDRKPRTSVHLTSKGILSFEDHVKALKKILGDS